MITGAVDIGGTKIAVGAIDSAGQLLARDETPTAAARGFEDAMERVTAMLERIRREINLPMRGVGIGCTGPVDPQRGTIGEVDFLPGWKGANPVTAYRDMVTSTFNGGDGIGSILIKATPLILAALAVAVPARAGLINVGGEGQLLVGGVAAMGTSLALGDRVPGTFALVLMIVAAMAAGAAWAAVAGVLRLAVGISESVTTLLLNYGSFARALAAFGLAPAN